MSRWPVVLIAFALLTCAPPSGGLEEQAAQNESVVWPAPPQQPRIRLIGTFGKPEDLGIKQSIFGRLWGWIAGPAPRAMVRPYAIAAMGSRVAVADPGAGVVHLYDLAGGGYQRIDSAGKQPLVSPVGVAIADDQVYVADSARARIFVFDDSGKLTRTLEGLQRPTGLAWDGERRRLYVTDTVSHSVAVLTPDGERLFSFGRRGTGDGEFNFPSHLSFADGRLYVNDTMNFRIQVFDPDGTFLSSFGKHGDSAGNFAQPKGIALDSEGDIYVVDALFNRVQIFNQRGKLLLVFGGDGGAPGELWLPSGLFIEHDRIYVADSYNRRVQVFQFLGGT